MAKLNIYRIDEEKKNEFVKNLTDKLDILKNKLIEKENGKKYNLTLYTFFSHEEKILSWNWLLNEFDENSFKYVATPKAIVTIEESNNMYVITFGSSYFLVDKFCDRKFAFEFAKRSEYKDIKTTALNSPNSLKN